MASRMDRIDFYGCRYIESGLLETQTEAADSGKKIYCNWPIHGTPRCNYFPIEVTILMINFSGSLNSHCQITTAFQPGLRAVALCDAGARLKCNHA